MKASRATSAQPIHSDHNKFIEISSFQFGVGRGITSSAGASVTSDHDTIDLGGQTNTVGIFVDGGNFHGTNDLITGGGASGAVNIGATGMLVSGSNENPTESVSFNFSKIEFVSRLMEDEGIYFGLIVDAAGDYWGTNTETGIAGSISGAAAANVDYSPWLDAGTNIVPTPGGKANPGFEGDFSALNVGSGGAQAVPQGLTQQGRIAEAFDYLQTATRRGCDGPGLRPKQRSGGDRCLQGRCCDQPEGLHEGRPRRGRHHRRR